MGRRAWGGLVAGLIALYLGWQYLAPDADVAQKAALRQEAGSEVPAIGLSRLGQRQEAQAPSRDVFKFGRASRGDLSPVPTPVIDLQPLPGATPVPTPEGPPTPTPWPPLNIAFIGIVDNGQGREVGSFVKDGEIVLVGEVGQILGNVFRVVRIGTESAEIEELGSGRTRRLALRAN